MTLDRKIATLPLYGISRLDGRQSSDFKHFHICVDNWQIIFLMLFFDLDGPKSMPNEELRILYFWCNCAILMLDPRSKMFVIGSLLAFIWEKGFFKEIAGADHGSTMSISQYYLLRLQIVIHQHYIQLLLMQKTKSSSHTAASTIRPITISSNFKFDKVEKLNQIVKNIAETKVQTTVTQLQSNITNPTEEKHLISQKVLETLKHRIKTNYDQLYSNYPDNKNKILKQIQTVETNIAGENQMNNKHEEVIKEKAKYDKLKAKIEQMQRKLKKLNDLRTQLQHQSGINVMSIEQTQQYQQKLSEFEEKKEQIEHTNLVLEEMLKQRKAVELQLKERYNKLTTELGKKKEKIDKLSLQNHKKKKLIMKIVQQIEKEQQFQIPAKLAEQLSSKLQQYENQHSYNQILQHEAILEEKRFQSMKSEAMKKREEQRQARLKKQNEEKNKLEEMHSLYMIGNLEQEKLKKLCAVQSISDVVNSNLNMDKETLEAINANIQEEIKKLTEENRLIQGQIEDIIAGKQDQQSAQETASELNEKLEQQLKKKKLLQIEYEKKSKLNNEWLTLMHLLNNNKTTKQSQVQFIKEMMNTQRKTVNQSARMRGSSNVTEELQSSNLK